MKRILGVCGLSLMLLSGCELLDGRYQTAEVAQLNKVQELCLFDPAVKSVEYNCDFDHWLDFWVAHDELSWPQRRNLINELGDTPVELLKKILLSQAKGTPYQNRLRAQGWADELMPQLTSGMQNVLQVLIYQPSQERLEFESALTILTRINTNQSKSLEAQQQKLQEQQQQIDKLLKIEASMMEKREGINQ